MPRYFFHVIDGTHFSDDVGNDCTDDQAALLEGVEAFAEILKGNGKKLLASGEWRLQVVDQADRAVGLFTLSTLPDREFV